MPLHKNSKKYKQIMAALVKAREAMALKRKRAKAQAKSGVPADGPHDTWKEARAAERRKLKQARKVELAKVKEDLQSERNDFEERVRKIELARAQSEHNEFTPEERKELNLSLKMNVEAAKRLLAVRAVLSLPDLDAETRIMAALALIQ